MTRELAQAVPSRANVSMVGDFLQGFRAHTAVCRHRGQEVSPTGAPEPCSLGNTNEPQGESKENESQENNRE